MLAHSRQVIASAIIITTVVPLSALAGAVRARRSEAPRSSRVARLLTVVALAVAYLNPLVQERVKLAYLQSMQKRPRALAGQSLDHLVAELGPPSLIHRASPQEKNSYVLYSRWPSQRVFRESRTPRRAKASSWRYSGRWSTYFWQSSQAMRGAVAVPPSTATGGERREARLDLSLLCDLGGRAVLDLVVFNKHQLGSAIVEYRRHLRADFHQLDPGLGAPPLILGKFRASQFPLEVGLVELAAIPASLGVLRCLLRSGTSASSCPARRSPAGLARCCLRRSRPRSQRHRRRAATGPRSTSAIHARRAGA